MSFESAAASMVYVPFWYFFIPPFMSLLTSCLWYGMKCAAGALVRCFKERGFGACCRGTTSVCFSERSKIILSNVATGLSYSVFFGVDMYLYIAIIRKTLSEGFVGWAAYQVIAARLFQTGIVSYACTLATLFWFSLEARAEASVEHIEDRQVQEMVDENQGLLASNDIVESFGAALNRRDEGAVVMDRIIAMMFYVPCLPFVITHIVPGIVTPALVLFIIASLVAAGIIKFCSMSTIRMWFCSRGDLVPIVIKFIVSLFVCLDLVSGSYAVLWYAGVPWTQLVQTDWSMRNTTRFILYEEDALWHFLSIFTIPLHFY